MKTGNVFGADSRAMDFYMNGSNRKNKKPANFSWADFNHQKIDDNCARGKTEENKTTREIIVKPDGSRVLVITKIVGGMETTMSIEISKPTEYYNNISKAEDKIKNPGRADISPLSL